MLPKDLIAAPAVILRPKLGTQKFKTTSSYIGGMPHLPDIYDWPVFGADETPYHFFAQINLSAMPRELVAGGKSWMMPDFPASGFLLIFLPLQGDTIDVIPPVILFHEDLRRCSKMPPPFDVPSLGQDDFLIDPDALSDRRNMLRQQGLSFLPCMSVRMITPHTDEVAPPMTPEMQKAIHTKHPKAVLRAPQQGADRAIALAAHLEAQEKATLMPEPRGLENSDDDDLTAPITRWTAVFEFSRHFLIGLIDEALRVTNGKISAGIGRKKMQGLFGDFEILKSQMQGLNINDAATSLPDLNVAKRNFIQRLISRLIPSSNLRKQLPLDVEASKWMGRAISGGDAIELAETIEFAQFAERIEALANSKRAVKLEMLRGASGVTVKPKKVRQSLIKALRAARNIVPAKTDQRKDVHVVGADPADVRWQAKVATQTQSQNSRLLGDEMIVPLQMFGHGDAIQTAAYDNRNKVMLFQLGNNFGDGFDFGDASIQVWISPIDLKQKRFDRINWTVETS